MTALLSVFNHDTDKVSLYVADCRRRFIEVLQPDLNSSGLDFGIENRDDYLPAIRYGMAAIKNVGEGAVQAIVDEREENGPFQSLQEFTRRIDLRQVGKRALESLIRVGVFDQFGSRSSILESLDRIMNISSAHFRAKEVGQITMFGSEGGIADELELPAPRFEVPHRQQLNWERELLGVYISDHPLAPYMEDLTRIVTHFSAELNETDHGQAVTMAGEIRNIRPYQTRAGKAMGFVTLEDIQGSIDLVVFSRVWGRVGSWIEPGMIVRVVGKIDKERGDPKVLTDDISQELSITTSMASAVAGGNSDLWEGSPPLDDVREQEPTELVDVDLVTMQAVVGEQMDRKPAEVDLPETHDRHNQIDDGEKSEPLDESSVSVEVETKIHELQEASDGDSSGSHLPDLSSTQDMSNEQTNALEDQQSTEIPPVSPRALEKTAIRIYDRSKGSEGDLSLIKVFLRSMGDRKRDTLRMRRVYGLLTSYPGSDRFVVYVFEGSRKYHLEFPNDTTGYSPELHSQLLELLGDANVQIEELRLQ
jgi:DNA polymerase-3 subunit alpha